MVSKIERTEIESKSQHASNTSANCKVGIKDRKNWNWKQITTIVFDKRYQLKLVSKIERTEIESKSQQQQFATKILDVGIKDRKNWNWKQITTHVPIFQTVIVLVSKIERTEIESKSQLIGNYPAIAAGWYQR